MKEYYFISSLFLFSCNHNRKHWKFIVNGELKNAADQKVYSRTNLF